MFREKAGLPDHLNHAGKQDIRLYSRIWNVYLCLTCLLFLETRVANMKHNVRLTISKYSPMPNSVELWFYSSSKRKVKWKSMDAIIGAIWSMWHNHKGSIWRSIKDLVSILMWIWMCSWNLNTCLNSQLVFSSLLGAPNCDGEKSRLRLQGDHFKMSILQGAPQWCLLVYKPHEK